MSHVYSIQADCWPLGLAGDIFDENQVMELAYEVREYYGFEGQDYAGEEYIYEDDAAEMDETSLRAQNKGLMTIGNITLMGIGMVIML